MGAHTISVTYSGDSNYLSSTSGAFKETIQDFSINVSPASSGSAPVVNPGSPASFSLILTPLGGPTMPAALVLGTKGLPPGSSVVFSPTSVAANSTTTPVTMVVTPPALGAKSPRNRSAVAHGPWRWGSSFCPLHAPCVEHDGGFRCWCLHCGRRLRRRSHACGSFTYTPQNLSVTVAATSGNLSHTATVKLTVK